MPKNGEIELTFNPFTRGAQSALYSDKEKKGEQNGQ